jgi:predicted bacteriocin transport accessory protein
MATKAKKESPIKEKEIIEREVINNNSNGLLSQIVVCLWVLIVLSVVSLITNIALNGTPSTKTETGSEEDPTATETIPEATTEEYKAIVDKMTSLDVDDLKSIFEKDEVSLINVGRTGCIWCRRFALILDEIIDNYDVKPYYIDTGDTNESISSAFDKIAELDEEYFNELGGLGTPLLLFVKNGEVVDIQMGYSNYETFEAKIEKYFDAK